MIWTCQSVDELRRYRRSLSGKVAFVPTMGALHAGHASLIQRARQLAGHVIVSIFVNPTQFGPNEDYSKYPRTFQADQALCQAAGATAVFAPTVDEVYPPGQSACVVEVPAVAKDLEGRCRPGHFAGVCRVVAKLLNMVQPEAACFGLKDYQQLAVIQAMVADLAMPVEIIPCQTKREADGLAMSSRNTYLTAEDRPWAAGLFKALKHAESMILQQQETRVPGIEQAMAEILRQHRMTLDYAVIRHPKTLDPLPQVDLASPDGVVALIAARLGAVRLIDNLRISSVADRSCLACGGMGATQSLV